MANAITIPSSSPPARPPSPSPPLPTATTESSSPGLPSPSSFFTKPASQATGFQTAASLLRSEHFRATENGTNAGENHAEMLPKLVKKAAVLPRKSRKPIAKSASFVLNSDDLASTQFAGLDATQVQGKRPDLEAVRHEKAPTEKPKRAPRKPKKQDGESEKPVKRTAKESAHFSKPLAAPGDDSAIDIGLEEPIQPAGTPIQAHRRRLSWTPARNTTSAALARPDTPASVKSNDEERPTLSLAAVLGDLAYAKQSTTASQRSASGEALLKRRRIELADEATTAPKVRKAPKSAEAEPKEKVKKVKQPKKKPQTITEIATKAYRPEDVPAAAQATVSSFFAAQNDGNDKDKVEPAVGTEEAAAKPKKPRKPREKKTGDDANADKPKKTAKSKAKAKVRFNEDDLFGKLYEPEQARLQEGKQDFLFGTSSQLGTRESPTFIRQMQLAMRESETMSTTQLTTSPSRKSYSRVPTAPHGTSLSCGQASRELWCSAARDHGNNTLAAEDRLLSRRADLDPKGTTPDLQAPAQAEITRSRPQTPSALLPRADLTKPSDTLERDLLEPTEREIVDLCFTSPPVAKDADLPVEPGISEELSDDYALPVVAETITQALHTASDDDWMILRSGDSSPDVPLSKRRTVQPPVLKPVPQLRRSATSPIRDRSALQALDANVSPRMLTSLHKAFLQKPLFSTTAMPVAKKPRGRPKKNTIAAIDTTLELSPLRPANLSGNIESQSVPEIHRSSPNKIFSASQPVTSSDFVNIDEISDSEPLNTPSPPRRRATSTPPTVRPLELEVVASPSVKAKVKAKSKKTEPKDTATPAIAWSKLKPEDASWITVMPELFPHITATIKSTAPSNDMAKPTWYEKILLYDPIVLEDLTAWLNEQGVRIETKKLKVKPKVKAKRKKRDAQQELDLVEDAVIVDEYETVQELLKPWMVQKWCEDKSVCCLWKEGLRGGVRIRY